MTREPSSLEQYLEAFDEAVEVCDGLRSLARVDAEDLPPGSRAGEIDAAFDQYMRSLFDYLEAKFEYFWFDDADFAAQVRAARPDLEEFSDGDMSDFVRTILYFVQAARYEADEGSPGDLVCVDPSPHPEASEPPAPVTVARAVLTRDPCTREDLEDFLTAVCARGAVGYYFTTADLAPAAREYLATLATGPFAGRIYVVDHARLQQLIEMTRDIIDEIEDAGLVAAIEDLDPEEEEFAFVASVEVLRLEAQEFLLGIDRDKG